MQMFYIDFDQAYEDIGNSTNGIDGYMGLSGPSDDHPCVTNNHSYENDTVDIAGVTPTIQQENTVTSPPSNETHESTTPSQTQKKRATYTLSQNEMLLLMLLTGVFTLVIAMVIMGSVMVVIIMPKFEDIGKNSTCLLYM